MIRRDSEIIVIFIWLSVIICWIINVVKFIQCDFASPYKEEIIHLIGILIPPSSVITVWF